MTITTTVRETYTPTQPARKAWQAPAIVLERSLEASAQGGPPQGPVIGPNGFMGPLGTSGDQGACVIPGP